MLALLGGAAASACGCVVLPANMRGASSLPVEPNSPVARDVKAAAEHPGPYPKFAQIPKVPRNVRPPSAWRAAVASVEHSRAKLESEVAALPPPQTDTAGFAAATQARAPTSAEAPGPNSEAQTEAYAEALRERATPPPPPK
jgi:hypothetical protein